MKRFEGFEHGVNLGGWLSQCVSYEKEHFDTFILEEDIKRIADWGLDHVRVPVDYSIIEKEDGTFKEDGFQYIDNCIAWCKKYGLHMLLDLHKVYGYTFDPLDHGDLEKFFHDKDLQERFIQTWSEIARRYGKYSDTVAFELLNEVVSPSVVDEWNTIIRNTTTAIREIAPDTYIVFGGVKYNNVTSVPLLIEPFADKLVYNFHCYDPFVFTHQKAYWVEGMPKDFEMSYPGSLELYREKSALFSRESTAAIYVEDIKEVGPQMFEVLFAQAVKTAEERGVALYCGEYGVIDQAPVEDSLRWIKDINSAFDKMGIGRALWNYKNKDYGIVDEHYAAIRDELVKYL